ncbi:MAG: LytTR family transcriptional regulator [Rhodobacteraceae bacterium]|nr:LytTR family transcriptional regulator [Paracoccaceae bacterium]
MPRHPMLFFWVALWVAATIVATLGGPFGTLESLGLWERGAYWGLMIGASVPIALGIVVLLRRAFPTLPFWLRSLQASILMALVYGGLIVAVNSVVYATDMPFHEAAGITLVISLALSLVSITLERLMREQGQRGSARFRARLPAELRGLPLHVQARDHQIEVRGEGGQATLLLRFSDALDELASEDGLQVHRSHWVARCAIAHGLIQGNRLFLMLKDGTEVPVSGPHRAALEAVGVRFDRPGEQAPRARPNP